MDYGGERLARQQRIVAVHDLVAHFGSGAKRRPLGGIYHTLEQLLHLRDDVGGIATIGDDVMQASGGWHVFAHHVDHVVHRLHPVERRSAPVWRDGRVRRNPVKLEPTRFVAVAALGRGEVAVARVPVQHRVHVVEKPGTNHVHLAGTAFLGRCAVHAHGAFAAALFQPAGQRNAGCDGRCAEEVVATSVPGSAGFYGLAHGHRCLREAW